jgi:hypothetical protein
MKLGLINLQDDQVWIWKIIELHARECLNEFQLQGITSLYLRLVKICISIRIIMGFVLIQASKELTYK